MWVALNDARTIGIPLRSFPKLMQADHEQLSKFEISYIGIHWDVLTEDISMNELLFINSNTKNISR